MKKSRKIIISLICVISLLFSCCVTVSAMPLTESNREDTIGKNELVNIMQAKEFTASDGTILPYRIYVPSDYDSSKSYPLVVSLHGSGCRGNDNESQFLNTSICNVLLTPENRQEYESIVIAPQCAEDYRWVETDWTKGSYTLTDDLPSPYLIAVEELIPELQQEYNIGNMYSTGVSMGGYGSWALILRHPDWFTAAINVCGAGDPSQAYKLKDIRVKAFHGNVDDTVPVQGSRDMVNAMKESGCNEVDYTEYGGMSHNIWYDAFTEQGLLDWLFYDETPDNSTWDGETCDVYYDGSGTQSDNYLISSAEELAGLAYKTNVENDNLSDKYFKLSKDINLQNNEWLPIGNIADFCGNFNGNAYTINNLCITDNTLESSGLFSTVNGSINNLNINNGDINSDKNVSILVGTLLQNSNIINCSVSGNLTGSMNTGSLVGVNNGNVLNSYSIASIDSKDTSGGIVGVNNGYICNCYFAGLSSNINTGGIAGISNISDIDNCYYSDTSNCLHGINNQSDSTTAHLTDSSYMKSQEFVDNLNSIVFNNNLSDDMMCWCCDDSYTNEGYPVLKSSIIPVSSIEVSNASLDIPVGTTSQLTASVLPNNASNKSLIFSSNDNGIATVDNLGNITATSIGNTTISVTSVQSGISEFCSINVYDNNNNNMSADNNTGNTTMNNNSNTYSTGDNNLPEYFAILGIIVSSLGIILTTKGIKKYIN